MYSESDLESAVSAGVITPQAAAALRDHVSAARASPMVDEENFRLLTGFNDIFVAIAGVLLLVGGAWIGNEVHPTVGAALVAMLAWGLSEYFTRVRHMALPSIIFLLAFVGGVFGLLVTFFLGDGDVGPDNQTGALVAAGCAAGAAGAAWVHWRRFHVPITVAAGALAIVAVIIGILLATIPLLDSFIYPALLILGLCVFAFAMRWDISDTARTTRRSDVAFWLHLLAAPMIAHPIFQMLGLLDHGANIGQATLVVAIYIAMGIVALAVDRRALLVSALAYVLVALGILFREFGAVGLNTALTAFVIGSALLLLSAFWHNARATVLQLLPDDIARRLPAVTPAARRTATA
jgi:hypothetical protein